MPVSPYTPWRSVWLPRAITAVALIVAIPLFLRSPPWCDITLYQMAARNILQGGVHYRDLFDTNLPGFVWAMTALYSVFGPNVIVVRVVDLLIVLGVVLLIDRLAKWGGASLAARWWVFAATALFYPFTGEMCHAQRDIWMALPGLAAVALRVRRGVKTQEEPNPPSPFPGREGGEMPLTSPLEGEVAADSRRESSRRVVGETPSEGDTPPPPGGEAPPTSPSGGEVKDKAPLPSREGIGAGGLGSSFYEGLLWGVAVWMKPHIVLMALAVWLLTAWRIAAEHPRPWRAVAADLLGNLLGGLVVGIPGVCWLFASGAWGDFCEVFMEWNPQYMQLANTEFGIRAKDELFWFPPWSLGLILTVPLALLSVLDMAPWSRRSGPDVDRYGAGWFGKWLPWQLWDKQAGVDARFVRGVLGGLYLAWAAQAFFVQRGFHYVHVPETLLMFGLWASHRWAWVCVGLLWLAITSGLWLVSDSSASLKDGLNGLSVQTRERSLPRHPISDTARLRLWPECWRLCMSDAERYALWDKLRVHPPHEASIGWEEIAELAEFFRAKGVKDGEVIAWFNSPHAVFLLLDVKPGLRYMHVYTAISISGDASGKVGHDRVMADLRTAKKNGAKYVISDLEWVALTAACENTRREDFLGPPRNPPRDLLPTRTPFPKLFPFNQPTVFRTRNGRGRYIVHLIRTPGDSK